MFKTAVSNFARSTRPAAFLIDLIPGREFSMLMLLMALILASVYYWPEWLPGGGFHATAKMWSKQLHETVDSIYEYVKNEMVSFLNT